MSTEVTPELLLEVRRTVAAAMLIEKGVFKKELDELEVAYQKLEAAYGVIPDLKAAKDARAKAESLLKIAEAERAEHLKKLAEELDKVNAMQKSVDETLSAAQAEKEQLVLKQRRADEASKANSEEHAKKMAELIARESRLNASENKLAADRRKLDDAAKRVRAAAQV
jgi:hypothetical protein